VKKSIDVFSLPFSLTSMVILSM